LQLAQPLQPSHETQREYNTLMLLAHRVQTLNTGQLNQYLESVSIDNSFFLRDTEPAQESPRRQLADLLAYHELAGHTRIYEKLNALAWNEPARNEHAFSLAIC
jgi:hypothetical protein